jgi:DNA-binding transcriptional LysR family regulator
MARPDLNLLVALDALLDEGSVAAAARRLRLSASAMSRTLARLREATGDPLLVRAGRGLVPTPRAVALRAEVGRVVEEAEALLRPGPALDLARLEQIFTLRTSDGFVETFGASLVARVAQAAPGVRLRFLPKSDRESGLLRSGAVDLETGVVGSETGPEIRARLLFRDRWIAAVRRGHPLTAGPVTAEAYAAAGHVGLSRRGSDRDHADDALGALGLERTVSALVHGFSAAIALARGTDLVATVPDRHTAGLRDGLVTIPLPFPMPEIPVALLWHPRHEADAAQRWLREEVKVACRAGDGA